MPEQSICTLWTFLAATFVFLSVSSPQRAGSGRKDRLFGCAENIPLDYGGRSDF